MFSLLRLFSAVMFVMFVYFFAGQIQLHSAKILKLLSQKIGTFTVDNEHAIQRYMYLHRGSLIAKFYSWVNDQIICLGLKRQGVTPLGFVCFWSLVNIPVTCTVWALLGLNVFNIAWLYVVLLTLFFMITRVYVAGTMQKREADIMDMEDLVIPDIQQGAKKAILRYKNNYAPSIRPDFDMFELNLNDRGYSFNEAMYALADNLGSIFGDFAQKCIYYEAVGEPDLLDIFADIVETNKLRRKLRYRNDIKFSTLKTSFLVSSLISAGYGLFTITTDEFSNYFFTKTDCGKILILIMILIVIWVLGYITTVKSKAL